MKSLTVNINSLNFRSFKNVGVYDFLQPLLRRLDLTVLQFILLD